MNGNPSEIGDRERFEHMLRAGRDALTMVSGRERADLDHDVMLQHALVHCVQMIGEAAARISPAGRYRVPQLPWTQIVGMRHILVHAYFNIDYDAVWRVVMDHIPEMIPLLASALDSWESEIDSPD
jgi:uncharacterized protein with HEPN domain